MDESRLTESEIFLKKKKAAYPSDGIAAESAIDVVLCQEFLLSFVSSGSKEIIAV